MRWHALGWVSPALAHLGLDQDLAGILGPGGWGLYLVLPLPFLLIGSVAWLLRRAVRKQQTHPTSPKGDGVPKSPK